MTSKDGIGEPYVQMRDAMMMGTTVIRDRKFIRVRMIDPGRYQPCSPSAIWATATAPPR